MCVVQVLGNGQSKREEAVFQIREESLEGRAGARLHREIESRARIQND